MGDFTKGESEEKVVRITSENKEYLIKKILYRVEAD